MAVSAIAVVASLSLHLPAYYGLGLLEGLLEERPAPTAPTMEVEIVESAPAAARAGDEPTPDAEDDVEGPEPPQPPEAIAAAAQPEPQRAEPEPEREPEPEPEPQVASRPPPQARPEPERRTSVAHRSRDPSVEPPEDAQHLAEENSRVEEETMARIRNPNLDDPEPQAAASEAAPEAPEEGDAAEERMAELSDAPGSDEREPTPEEARLPPREREVAEPSTSPTPSVSEAARGRGRSGGDPGPSPARQAAGGGRRAEGGGEEVFEEVVVSDGAGTFTIRVPRSERPEGTGEGGGGGEAIAGRGRGRTGQGSAAGPQGRGRRRARGGAAPGVGAVDLRVSWSQLASIYGEEELRRERELILEQRRSHVRGSNRAERWRRFRAAIENYDVRVRPGNQTALNTRADPFAAYIAAMHRRIHPRFAQGYLSRVPSSVEETFRGNPNMHTKLELAVDAQGRVDHVSVVATSGDILFDLGAYESVMGAQPFPAPPENIRSPDGLVYLHWSFYRNHRQCGTFNAESYILAEAPSRPERDGPSGDELLDRGATFRSNDEQ